MSSTVIRYLLGACRAVDAIAKALGLPYSSYYEHLRRYANSSRHRPQRLSKGVGKCSGAGATARGRECDEPRYTSVALGTRQDRARPRTIGSRFLYYRGAEEHFPENAGGSGAPGGARATRPYDRRERVCSERSTKRASRGARGGEPGTGVEPPNQPPGDANSVRGLLTVLGQIW
jgi:hypothetical protein